MIEETTLMGLGDCKQLTDKQFEAIFEEIDENDNGVIDQREMVSLIRLVLQI